MSRSWIYWLVQDSSLRWQVLANFFVWLLCFDFLEKTKQTMILTFSFNMMSQLKGSGYVNIEAIDGCRDMLELANTKKLYRDFHIALLGGGNSAPIPSGVSKI